jgi:hypothetical protein
VIRPAPRRTPAVDYRRPSLIHFARMKLPRGKIVLRLLAALALLTFTGDLVADMVVGMTQCDCPSETSQSAPCNDKAPCSHCCCATHASAVVIGDFAMRLSSDLRPTPLLHSGDEAMPPPLAASIDHPPQLA